MPATPITDDSWSGLPLLVCDMDPGLYEIDVQRPILVIRDDVGTQVEVLNRGSGRLAFRQAPHRFDLFAAGLRMNATSDRLRTMSLVVALTPDWAPVDDECPDRRPELEPRFQFADAALRRLVWRLSTHQRCGEPLGRMYSEAVSRSIVDRTVRVQLERAAGLPGRRGLHPEARRVVEALIESALHDPPTTTALAARVGLGVRAFAREFKTTFKATPHQYMQQRRLQRAQELMRATDATLATIAADTGFSSHAHFSTVFRAVTGQSPRAWRDAAARCRA
jgi:AraC family transcriptional regulator